MATRKKSASKQPTPSQPRPELALYPRRGRSVITLVLCLLILAIITDALLSIFSGTSGPGTELLFAVFFVICVIFLLGLGWSAVRLLTDRRPSFQIDEEGLTVRHLPFLGNVVVPWNEIRSVHTYRSLFFSYLCFVPHDIPQLVRRYGLLRFVFNSSTRLGLRGGIALTISQALLETPVNELAQRIEQEYGVKPTPGIIGK